MTRTEERLVDALDASAGRVRDDRLRLLPVLEPGAGAGSRKAWRGWLVLAAAAVSVALVIGLALAVTGGASWRSASGAPVVSNRVGAGYPTYFADVTSSPSGLTVQVRSTSTGSVVASAPSPQTPGWALIYSAMSASPPRIAVERVSASTRALISVEYRSAPFGQGRQPNYVTISRDPSGRYLLLTYGGPAWFFTGWIDHSKLRFLPIAQPHLGYPISA